MMYKCEIEFSLNVTTVKRSLEVNPIKGKCKQTGTAYGSKGKKPTVASCTGMLDCTAELESDDDISIIKAYDFIMTSVNGNYNLKDYVDASGLTEENLIDKTGTGFEDDMKNGGNFYGFDQSNKKCKCNKNGEASLNLKGTVAGYDEDEIITEYSFKTTENEIATCTFVKEVKTDVATVGCKVHTSSKEFNFINYESKNNEGDTPSTIYIENDSGSSLCEVEDDSSNNINKGSSSSGISGGAVAGIVVGSVAVALVAGGIIAFFAITAKTVGVGVATAVAGQAAASSSQTGFVVSTATTTGNIPA